MNDYLKFLESKKKTFLESGFETDELNHNLFDFQKYAVSIALRKGRFALFFDCGLGKTLMQLSWANAVYNHTGIKVLLLAPLAVVEQTKEEAIRFGIDLNSFDITNYDQLKNIDTGIYSGVVLDESSILKGRDGKLSKLIIDSFKNTPYKLACTATPSPNDHMELGQHSEFLGAMTYLEMLAMYFVHDGGETSKWRLRAHAKDPFWKFVCTWSMACDNPKTLGFVHDGYDLPEIEFIEHIVEVENNTSNLFGDVSVSATDLHKDLNRSLKKRIEKTVELVNSNDGNWLIWGLSNDECISVNNRIEGSENIQGSDSSERKKVLSLFYSNDKNECKCQTKKKDGINIIPKTKKKLTENVTSALNKGESMMMNIGNQELNIQENIIQKTNQNSTIELKNKTKNEIGLEEKSTLTTKYIENLLNQNQENLQRETLIQEYPENLSKNTTSQLKNITECSKCKMEDAQFAQENHHSMHLTKDCTSTIATKQEELEDCYALTAIKDSVSLKTIQNLSKTLCPICKKVNKKVLVSKTSILGFGVNFQNFNQMVFMSYDFKFEQFYQAVRRCYRFGQKRKVFVHILIPESQINVRQTILEKQKRHFEMIQEMAKYSSESDYKSSKSKFSVKNKEIKTQNYHLINGDCVRESKNLKDNSADLVVFSPPFAELYVYSDKEEDMGNVSDYKQFEQHFKYLIPELKRVLKSGRICAVHCMDLPIQKGKEGYIGLRDFSGMLIDWFQDEGFIYHSRVTIWKNPVTEMQRTKALGLLHKTIKKDSSMTRVGIPDYVLFFRNEGENESPITHQDTDPTKSDYLPVDLWQKYASPVWYDINYSRTLQYRSGRDGNDEKHICPLQLDTIERIIHLYSNEGETVFSPFGGIGSEGFQAIKMGRKSISIELKESYFSLNAKNHNDAVVEKNAILTLF